MDEQRKAGLLAYCKLTELADDPEVDALIPVLYNAAVGYLTDAGISTPEAGTPRAAQYDLCVNCLVLSAYEQRNASIAGSTVMENPMFRQMLNQLKWADTQSATF